MVENAVIRMTSVSGLRSLIRRSTVSPSPSGSLKSRRTRSTSSRACSMASAAVAGFEDLCPSPDSRSRSDQRTSYSSSTTRILEWDIAGSI